MIDDPIVDDVHRIRAELLAHHNGDLRAYFKELQRLAQIDHQQNGQPAITGAHGPAAGEAVKKAG